jgi:Na+-transporting methylmalonyl-CoA/oxaloacetate decarboxylase gamma subunit
MDIDSELVREGVRLTVFGLSTAFGLLITLMVMTWALSQGVGIQARRAVRRSEAAAVAHEAASREKALAAVVAVSTLLGTNTDADSEAAAP